MDCVLFSNNVDIAINFIIYNKITNLKKIKLRYQNINATN